MFSNLLMILKILNMLVIIATIIVISIHYDHDEDGDLHESRISRFSGNRKREICSSKRSAHISSIYWSVELWYWVNVYEYLHQQT